MAFSAVATGGLELEGGAAGLVGGSGGALLHAHFAGPKGEGRETATAAVTIR